MDYAYLDKLLKSMRMSRRKLAELTGINQNTLSAAFRRKSENFSLESVMKIAHVLNVEWWKLMGWEDFGGGFYGKEAEPGKYEYWSNYLFRRGIPKLPNNNPRELLLGLFDSMDEDTQNEAYVMFEHYENLTDEGRHLVIDFLDMLSENPRYVRYPNTPLQ